MDSLIQKTIIPYFTSVSPLEPTWFRVMYPYFWHPFKGIIVTVTIYLMLAISAERFRAVCYPLSKRHVSFLPLNYRTFIARQNKFLKSDSLDCTNLIIGDIFQSPYKYVIVVVVTSVILKLPRFFHFKLIAIYGVTQYWTTSIMEDTTFIRFSSYWDDLFSTGVLPLSISIYFNLRIFLKVCCYKHKNTA